MLSYICCAFGFICIAISLGCILLSWSRKNKSYLWGTLICIFSRTLSEILYVLVSYQWTVTDCLAVLSSCLIRNFFFSIIVLIVYACASVFEYKGDFLSQMQIIGSLTIALISSTEVYSQIVYIFKIYSEIGS